MKAWYMLVGLALVLLLAACGGEPGAGDPAAAVQQYLQAKTQSDQPVISRLLCSDMESLLEREVMSFDGVEARLEDVACTANNAAELVTCSGAIVAVYGGEDTVFPLGTYRVVQEAGEWKWCGEAG